MNSETPPWIAKAHADDVVGQILQCSSCGMRRSFPISSMFVRRCVHMPSSPAESGCQTQKRNPQTHLKDKEYVVRRHAHIAKLISPMQYECVFQRFCASMSSHTR